MTITHSGEKFDLEREVKRLTKKGIFDKAISLDYVALINPESIFLRCKTDNNLSFRINNKYLNPADKEIFQTEKGEDRELLTFNGYLNRFYHLGIGELKGYIHSLRNNKEILIGVKNGEAKRVVNEINLLTFQAMTAEFPSSNKDKPHSKSYFPLL